MGLSLGRAKRLEQILSVLGKYGLADWLPDSSPDLISRLLKSADGQELAELSRESRVRMALLELGPTFVKLGQTLSTRGDVVGPELATELSQLQSDGPADPPEVVHATIERELGRPVAEIFARFDDIPTASASIGQVHHAYLPDGRSVAIKVQHPDIEESVTHDLEILAHLAGLAERHSDLRSYRPRALVAEFRRLILRELDFSRERLNQERLRAAFADDPTVRIPRTIEPLSSERVLTMEWIAGIPLNDAERLADSAVDTAEVARRGSDLWLQMIFRHGEYHADPHPGNVLILPGGVVGLLDFGRVGRLDTSTREQLEELVVAAVESDTAELVDIITRLCEVPRDLDKESLKSQVADFVDDYLRLEMENLDLTEALLRLMEIVRSHRLMLPSSVSLLIKVLAQLEGTSRLLQRDFNLSELLRPFYSRAVASRWSPRRLALVLQSGYRDWSRLLGTLPRDLAEISQRVRAGSFDINLKHRHLDMVVNRLAHGVLTAASVVAAALLLSMGVPPKIFGLSVLGLAASAGAVMLSLRLLFAIRRSGGL